MVYKYKNKFKYRTHGIEDEWNELDHVYSQAAKADEYEAKAKAFDRLVDTAYWHLERIDPEGNNVLQFESFYKDIRDELKKYESGGYDAKK